MMGAAEIAPVLYVSFLSAVLCIVIGICLGRRGLQRKQRKRTSKAGRRRMSALMIYAAVILGSHRPLPRQRRQRIANAHFFSALSGVRLLA